MEQSTEASTPTAPAENNKPKSGNGLKITTAIACITAVCGIGFGIFGMTQSLQKDSQISSLKTQVEESGKTTTEAPDVEINIDDSLTATTADAEKYIYIGELGLKIKKPEPNIVNNKVQDKSISGISYVIDGHRLYIWGTVYRDGDQAVGDGTFYANNGQISSPYLAEIESSSIDNCSRGEKIGEFNGKSLCYAETDSNVLTNSFNSNAMEKYIQPTMEILKEHFTNMNNYSQF